MFFTNLILNWFFQLETHQLLKNLLFFVKRFHISQLNLFWISKKNITSREMRMIYFPRLDLASNVQIFLFLPELIIYRFQMSHYVFGIEVFLEDPSARFFLLATSNKVVANQISTRLLPSRQYSWPLSLFDKRSPFLSGQRLVFRGLWVYVTL